MHQNGESSGSIVLSQLVMLLGGLAMAGMAWATWRAVGVAVVHNAAVMAEQRRHNQQLVTSIETLAEQAGVLTSADLCPVRFRLRSQDGISAPVRSPYAVVERESAGEFHLLHEDFANVAGTLDFGLNPPGRYRLSIEMDDGMHMQHEFDVLPGVPIDRLITCPKGAPPQNRIQVELDWPEPLATQQLLAVCCIEPAPYAHGRWRWHPSPQWSPVHALVCSSERAPSASEVSGLSQSNLIPDDAGSGLQGAAGLTVSFRYCRLAQITFLGRVGENPDLVALGTAVFTDAPNPVKPPSVDSVVWFSKAPAPMFECRYQHPSEHWLVPVPEEIVDELLKRIQEVTAAAQGVASDHETDSGAL